MPTDCIFCQKLTRLAMLPDDERVWEFPQSIVLLGPWQYYHGYSIVVSRHHCRELWHLERRLRNAFVEEMLTAAQAIDAAFAPRKLNLELLGNQVPHLHGHLFPRYESDPAKLKPVWIAIDAADRDPAVRLQLEHGPVPRQETAERLRSAIRDRLG